MQCCSSPSLPQRPAACTSSTCFVYDTLQAWCMHCRAQLCQGSDDGAPHRHRRGIQGAPAAHGRGSAACRHLIAGGLYHNVPRCGGTAKRPQAEVAPSCPAAQPAQPLDVIQSAGPQLAHLPMSPCVDRQATLMCRALRRTRPWPAACSGSLPLQTCGSTPPPVRRGGGQAAVLLRLRLATAAGQCCCAFSH